MFNAKHSRIFITIILAISLLSNVSYAVTYPDKPSNQDFYVDKAYLISVDHITEINKISSELLKSEKIPLFVVTIPSLLKYEAHTLGIEQYTRKLFDHWGIGFENRNYGMLLVVSVGDRKARLELGKGWDNQYNQQATEIMQSLIIPAFKRDDYSTGIMDGVRGMDALARGLQLPKPTAPMWFWPAVIIGFIGLVLLIINLFKTGRSGWAWALIAFIGIAAFFILRNANSGGSGGGFGGGSSGGGGATGSW